jgi:hypothetical protein
LLKIDTDGYDWDVLNSAKSIIYQSKPLIYFEIFTENLSGLDNYLHALSSLKSCGYEDFYIFDNFGDYIAMTNLVTLESMMRYVLRQNNLMATRTIHYFDVLTCVKEDRPLVETSIKRFY